MQTKALSPARKPRKPAREKFPDTPDPIEIAMIAAASGKPLPDAARNVLEKHARLIDAQCSELKLRRVGEGVRALLWGTLAIAAFGFIALIIVVMVRASRSDALIVQSFRVPPALAEKGLSGEVIATQVLDKLAEMQGRTDSVRAASTYANNWEDELKIDIPNTGATTDQVWKLLRSSLGKETRISGEVVDAVDGLALTARVGSTPGQRFQSKTADLDALVTQAAELIYRQTQPYRYAIYVARSGREAERYPIFKQLTVHPSPMERKWAYSGLSYDLNIRGDFAASIRMAERALAIDSLMVPAMANGARAHEALGHEQAALDMRMRALEIKTPNAEYDPIVAARNLCGSYLDAAWSLRDPERYEDAAACSERADALDTETPTIARAFAALLRHDPALALRFSFKPDPDIPVGYVERVNANNRLQALLASGAVSGLAVALDNFRQVADLTPASGFAAAAIRAAAPATDWPLEAEVLIQLGRLDEAQVLIARTPLDCYNCVRVRGLVSQARGDAPAAQRWFAEAVRQGPRLAPAYVDWARLLARHRRFEAAEARFLKASKLAANWPDPLKYWGDSLTAQGKRSEALTKYDAALRLAPRWSELRQARIRSALR